jgi:hypothetical protein
MDTMKMTTTGTPLLLMGLFASEALNSCRDISGQL